MEIIQETVKKHVDSLRFDLCDIHHRGTIMYRGLPAYWNYLSFKEDISKT